MKPYDLHNHSILSKDGKTPARELIDIAVERGLKGLGICDHDEFADENLYDYAHFKGIKLALGTEFTCNKAHIIGYNMNLAGEDRQFLEDKFNQLRKNYVNIAKKTIEDLQGLGFDISYEKVQKYCGKEHVQKLFIFKYLSDELKAFKSWGEARRFLQKETNYVEDGWGIQEISPEKMVDIINKAGGFAIWAHPFITPSDNREKYFETLPQHGIGAVEADYAYRENGYKGNESNKDIDNLVRNRLKVIKIPVSGGSDSHVPVKTFVNGKVILPGDFGITQEEFEVIKHIFR